MTISQAIPDTPVQMKQRKDDHIAICMQQPVESQGTPFATCRLQPQALPEMDFQDVDLAQDFLGRMFSMPLLITGMTGGTKNGVQVNQALALAAQTYNIPMGLGSQKMMIKDRSFRPFFDVRTVAPKVFLIGNLGAVSLNYGVSVDDVRWLVDDLKLDAFALHLNALQECIQPEGERNFSDLLQKIEVLARLLPVPLIAKEVGSGLGAHTCRRLVDAGIRAIDVGGHGGTSWSVIEGYRGNALGQRLGELFRNWGLSTEESLAQCVRAVPSGFPLIATGGMRDGLQVAKAVARGARMVGVGLPLFRAAVSPPAGQSAQEAVENELAFFQQSLKIALFCSGARCLNSLPECVLDVERE